jgi:hypothetical protein
MAGDVTRIEPGETLDAPGYFKGPWRSFARSSVDAGASQVFDAADCEYSIFVMSGKAVLQVGATQQPATPGKAITVGYRAQVTISAQDEPVELFVTTLDVTAAPAATEGA